MPKIVLIGATSELGNATARKFLECESSPFESIIRVGRYSKNVDIAWTREDFQPERLKRIIEACNIQSGDLVLVAIASLSAGFVEQDLRNFDEIEAFETILVSGAVPTVMALGLLKRLEAAGGGGLILFSSVAAFPPLRSNAIYGASKFLLDNVVGEAASIVVRNNVDVTIVRPGFVQTKLNAGRRPTLFASSVEAVANDIFRKHPKSVIWTPAIFQLVTRALRTSGYLRAQANKLVSAGMRSST